MSEQIRRLVSLASRVLGASGHRDFIWGHASARDPAGRGVWIKGAGWGLEEVTPDRVHLVDGHGVVVEGTGARHSEYPIHTEIMAARPDVGAVVHTHAPHAVALAAAGLPLRPMSHAANLFVPPDIPRFTATGDLILTRHLGEQVAAQLGDATALFLLHHGIVTVGQDLPAATMAAVLLEQAARQQLLVQQFGGSPTWSDPHESLSKRSNCYSRPALLQAFEYLVRRLPPAGDDMFIDDAAHTGVTDVGP
ncbi:hypothetical protein GCM10011609_85140 [Lentzea pudingi]|uniref:Class II aldolase/adducin N-terminal domain-containing protein n=1 Tax=Lentzea pudingi TaxID=1789439 RepID=A0ABQ2IS41_9PSEU|nr:class II aldolase/adducin family protein [Lentzea pudingi]GGN28730.1 hypothetical protein GCM10011609_85140 [Lentzea pudingi]